MVPGASRLYLRFTGIQDAMSMKSRSGTVLVCVCYSPRFPVRGAHRKGPCIYFSSYSIFNGIVDCIITLIFTPGGPCGATSGVWESTTALPAVHQGPLDLLALLQIDVPGRMHPPLLLLVPVDPMRKGRPPQEKGERVHSLQWEVGVCSSGASATDDRMMVQSQLKLTTGMSLC